MRRRLPALHRALPALVALGTAGCAKMAIDGQATDVAGEPIEGALITALGKVCDDVPGPDGPTRECTNGPFCQVEADESGRFSAVCNPGLYDVNIAAKGYITKTVEDYDASERKRYDLGKQVLVRVPEQKGLLRFDGNSYLEMPLGLLEKRTGGSGNGAWRAYCLPLEGTTGLKLPPGVHPFFDNESPSWRAFRLDAEGCAYRMSKVGPTSWGVDYGEKAHTEVKQLEQGKDIVLMDLPEGRYFIALWDQGFFKESTLDGKTGYQGHYLEVGQ